MKTAQDGSKRDFPFDFSSFGIESLGTWMKSSDPSTYTSQTKGAIVRLMKHEDGSYGLVSAFPTPK
ncbi:TPA: hypothetical protein HA238_05720 [Candidatus Micrarchaeota archaeon]|nr:hypothetical protein [Candidatus Micrarchaeota archaeon]